MSRYEVEGPERAPDFQPHYLVQKMQNGAWVVEMRYPYDDMTVHMQRDAADELGRQIRNQERCRTQVIDVDWGMERQVSSFGIKEF